MSLLCFQLHRVNHVRDLHKYLLTLHTKGHIHYISSSNKTHSFQVIFKIHISNKRLETNMPWGLIREEKTKSTCKKDRNQLVVFIRISHWRCRMSRISPEPYQSSTPDEHAIESFGSRFEHPIQEGSGSALIWWIRFWRVETRRRWTQIQTFW